MKILIIHITDLHIHNTEDVKAIDIKAIIESLKLLGSVDDVVLVSSGDIAFCGKKEEYDCAAHFYINFFKALSKAFNVNYINHIVVPGNHDIVFDNLSRGMSDIEKAYHEKKIGTIVSNDLKFMKDFFDFAQKNKCFKDDQIVSKITIKEGEKAIGFILLNTVPLSLLKSANEDKGIHYLSKSDLEKINRLAVDDINVLVMHHNVEWMNQNIKDELRMIIAQKYPLVLSGHEHLNVTENISINDSQNVYFSQGNALNGAASKGFSAFIIDLDSDEMMPYSFKCVNSVYTFQQNNTIKLPHKVAGRFTINPVRLKELSCNSSGEDYDKCYVFPQINYDDKESEERYTEIDNIDLLSQIVCENKKVYIHGEKKTGKTALSSLLLRDLSKKEMIPVLFVASEINHKRINTIIKNMFEDLYLVTDETYTNFLQYEKNNKIAIIDEFEKISTDDAYSLLEVLSGEFEHIVIFSEKKIDLDIKKKAKDSLNEEDKIVNLSLMPFLYSKRKELIGKVLNCLGNHDSKEVEKINNLINTQIKFFDLSPEFITDFIKQYEEQYQFQFASGVNTFSVVYENSVKNKVISNSKDVDPGLTLNILGNLAFYMHFSKKCDVDLSEISQVIQQYNSDYRQEVKVVTFIDTMIKANILAEQCNRYKFEDATIEAYFVARAINQKAASEDVTGEVEYMLKNMCFGINSDIILYLSLINSDARYLSLIVKGAKKHFENQEEFSFDSGNLDNLLKININEKTEIPTKEEKQKREHEKNRQEEEEIENVIQLVDEYDYTEEDLLKIENQLLISFKYIDILCKILPAFCYNMKAPQQDEVTALIYSTPNIFLYSALRDLNDNIEEFTDELMNEWVKNNPHETIKREDVSKILAKISVNMIWNLFYKVSSTCSNEQSIRALNSFEYKDNTNYELINLLMRCQCEDVGSFSKEAIDLDKKTKLPIAKSFIKNTVWNYFLKNDIYMIGEAQSLRDYFFENKESKRSLKMNMAKNKINDNK